MTDTDAHAPRADGRSPAQVLLGRPLRSAVPAHRRTYADRRRWTADGCDARAAARQHRKAGRYQTGYVTQCGSDTVG